MALQACRFRRRSPPPVAERPASTPAARRAPHAPIRCGSVLVALRGANDRLARLPGRAQRDVRLFASKRRGRHRLLKARCVCAF